MGNLYELIIITLQVLPRDDEFRLKRSNPFTNELTIAEKFIYSLIDEPSQKYFT